MKKVSFILVASILCASTLFAANVPTNTGVKTVKQTTTKTKKAAKYTCSMHPEFTSNKPGKCPKCGMALVKKEKAKKTVM